MHCFYYLNEFHNFPLDLRTRNDVPWILKHNICSLNLCSYINLWTEFVTCHANDQNEREESINKEWSVRWGRQHFFKIYNKMKKLY